MTASYQAKACFPVAYRDLFQACLTAIDESGFALSSSDPELGEIMANNGTTIWSFGERIEIKIDRDGTLEIESECSEPAQTFDWGKNKRNVNQLLRRVSIAIDLPVVEYTDKSDGGSVIAEDFEEVGIRDGTEVVSREDYPVDNRFGSETISLKHELSKTVSNEANVEASSDVEAKVGAELFTVITAELRAALTRKYGFLHGETVTRRYTLNFGVKPGDFIVYSVIWKQKTQSGSFRVNVGEDIWDIPFHARFGLTYELSTERK